MRPDHTVTEFTQPQPMLATLEGVRESAPQRQPSVSALTRVTFCFAWLFGLEPFLTGSAEDVWPSSFDRH
jgi:hypothetical protein